MKPRRLRAWGAILGVFLLVGIVAADVGRDFLSADSLNSTTALPLPAWLDDLTRRSAVAYPSHAALGMALETLHLSPAASAVSAIARFRSCSARMPSSTVSFATSR